MDYKICFLVLVLIVLWYSTKNNIIHDNKYSTIINHGKNVKKIFKRDPNVSIEEQVKINNNSGVSPKILDYGDNFIIMEKADITLRDMFYYFKLNKEKIDKLIKLFRKLDKYEYSHNDLNWRNIMWNNSIKNFQIIDWEYATPRVEPVPKIDNDMEYLKYNIYKISNNLDDDVIDLGCDIMENIYNNRSSLETIKGFYLFLKY